MADRLGLVRACSGTATTGRTLKRFMDQFD